jgi:hypothetical protein
MNRNEAATRADNSIASSIVGAYQIAAYLTGAWIYISGLVGHFALGQVGMCAAWAMFVGPVLAPLGGLFWPIYWLLMLSQWGAL